EALRKPKRNTSPRAVQLAPEAINFKVVGLLRSVALYKLHDDKWSLSLPDRDERQLTAAHRAVFERVMRHIGGTCEHQVGRVVFDYNPRPVLDDIVRTGVLPDQQAHQFYPTP